MLSLFQVVLWCGVGKAKLMATLVVNTHEAKSRLSELIRQAESGVEVIVPRSGDPVAKIIPWPPVDRPVRVPGVRAGLVGCDDDDLVGSDPEIVAMFEEHPGNAGKLLTAGGFIVLQCSPPKGR